MPYIGNQPSESFTSFATQEFSTSATTSYTLDHAVTNENEIALFINNVRQQPGSGKAYTATGTALTLSEATASTDTMYCVFLGRALQTVTPATNSITNAMITDNTIESGKLFSTFKNGITMADEFRLTSDKTVSNTSSGITANLARTTRAGFSLLGSSGMTESSGIFTFPSTGYYMVGVFNSYTTTDANRSNAVRLYVTTNNSTYYNIGASSVNASDDGGSSNSFGGIYSEYLIDVTNTSNVKVKFDAIANNNAVTYNGSTSSTSDGSSTRFMFRRIGDT